MRISLEEAAPQSLHQLITHDLASQAFTIHTMPGQPIRVVQVIENIVQGGAVDVLGHKHAAGRQLVVDERNIHALDLHRSQSAGGLCLVAIVELAPSEGHNLVDDCCQLLPGHAQHNMHACIPHNVGQNVKVAVKDRLSAGPLHLDRHSLAILKRAPVHLPNGRTGQRLGVDPLEEVPPVLAKLVRQCSLHNCERQRQGAIE